MKHQKEISKKARATINKKGECDLLTSDLFTNLLTFIDSF